MVAKSAVRKRLTTPGIASKAAASSLSAAFAAVNVIGPPTGLPTVNLRALGLGVLSITTGISSLLRVGSALAVSRRPGVFATQSIVATMMEP